MGGVFHVTGFKPANIGLHSMCQAAGTTRISIPSAFQLSPRWARDVNRLLYRLAYFLANHFVKNVAVLEGA
jgi:hypothetical protein